MKKHLIPLLALLLASLLGVFAFWIEMRQNGLYGWYSGVVYARWCFLVIPGLFFAWLFAFCRVRVRLWKWLVFALSYAVWFALLFAYPIFVIFFSTVFYLPEELISNGWAYYSFSYFCQPVHHFYKGSVIFGYMMTEGLFFLRHNFAKIEGK